MRLMEMSKQGPVCKFGDAHILYTLMILNDEGHISRGDLAAVLGIGEGSVRKIIAILRDWGLIEVRQNGVYLSHDGRNFLDGMPLDLVDIPYTEGNPEQYLQGVLVRGMADKITNGMDQRDSAVIAGASGASVYYLEDNYLMVSTLWEKSRCDAELSNRILGITDIKEDDVLLVTVASKPELATVSAIAAGLDMI